MGHTACVRIRFFKMVTVNGDLLIPTGILLLLITKVMSQCSGGEQTLTAAPSAQFVSSPNYPDNYDSDLDCYWLLQSPAVEDRVIINLGSLDLVASTGCVQDFLNVYDGPTNSSALLATVCNDNRDVISVLVSTGDVMLLWLHTDASVSGAGFHALYFSNDRAIQQAEDCSSGDEIVLAATWTTQFIMSANWPNPYARDYNCTTFIQASTPSHVLRFQIFLVDLEESQDCLIDSLTFSEGANISSLTEVTTQCPTAFSYTYNVVTTRLPLAAVTMVTRSAANTRYGFVVGYRQIQDGINLTYPTDGQTVSITIDEDYTVGIINTTQTRIDVTSSGELSFTLYQDGGNSSADFEVVLDPASGTHHVSIFNALDYETRPDHHLVVIISDDIKPSLSGTVYFNISLVDVDDNAPAMNLPGNATVRRLDTTGHSVFIVTSTDADFTTAFQVPAYTIFGGNSENLLTVDEVSGEITLAKPASGISLAVTSYPITVAAFSVSLSSGIASFGLFTLYFYPDDPPVCSHATVWAHAIGADTHTRGSLVAFSDSWNCTDEGTIKYTLGTVSPQLNTSLFSLNNLTGEITVTRSFTLTELPTRQFSLEIIAADVLGQTTEFTVFFNVTTLKCLPNPRKLYVRMGTALGTPLVSPSYNCSSEGLTFAIKQQYPAGTFGMVDSTVILLSAVYKIRFYTLVISGTDGTDTVDLTFDVTVRFPQCNYMYMLSNAGPTLASNMAAIMATWVAWLVT